MFLAKGRNVPIFLQLYLPTIQHCCSMNSSVLNSPERLFLLAIFTFSEPFCSSPHPQNTFCSVLKSSEVSPVAQEPECFSSGVECDHLPLCLPPKNILHTISPSLPLCPLPTMLKNILYMIYSYYASQHTAYNAYNTIFLTYFYYLKLPSPHFLTEGGGGGGALALEIVASFLYNVEILLWSQYMPLFSNEMHIKLVL